MLGSGFRVKSRALGFSFGSQIRVEGSGSWFGFRVPGFGLNFCFRGLFWVLEFVSVFGFRVKHVKSRRLEPSSVVSKWSFSIAIICTTSRRIPASVSTNRGHKKNDFI